MAKQPDPRKRMKALQTKNWCPRCQEREAVPEPCHSLLNTRHEVFCRNLAIHKMTNSEAYTAAGFSKNINQASKSACGLKRRLDVSNRIEFLLSQTMEQDFKTKGWVDDQLKEIVDRCMQAKPHLGKNGQPDGQWVFDGANANKALYAMGKDRGMFVEKVEIGGLDAELSGKGVDELLEMVAAAAIDLGRDFIKQLGEKVGLQLEEVGKDDSGATTAPDGSVPALH